MDGQDSQDRNEYFVTAYQIFEFCGVKSTGTLSVEALMEKFMPSKKSNKSEYKYLKHILDPMAMNPEIDVTTLAQALHQYSESKKVKVDLDDSINLKGGGAPHDSDSGISNDDYQLVEELRSELKDKKQIASQLREQINFMEQHNEAEVHKLTTERDGLKAQIFLLKEDKTKLSEMSSEIAETSSRLVIAENLLETARRDLELTNRQVKQLEHEVEKLILDKQTLQDQLLKSKEECHRMNDLYASRQVNLLEENETLKTEHADISIKYNEQTILLEQIVQEKLLLEMELRDVFDKSNQSPRMDNTIDISYTEDQMLSTLDSLTADSRFGQQLLLDEDAFVKELKDCAKGRSTNMSLFDEIRHSFCNSPLEFGETPQKNCKNYNLELTSIGTQTDQTNISLNENDSIESKILSALKICTDDAKKVTELKTVFTQTSIDDNFKCLPTVKKVHKCKNLAPHDNKKIKEFKTVFTQTSDDLIKDYIKTVDELKNKCKILNQQIEKKHNSTSKICLECEKLKLEKLNLENDLNVLNKTIIESEKKIIKDEDKIKILKQITLAGKTHNKQQQIIIGNLRSKIEAMEEKIKEQNLHLMKPSPKKYFQLCTRSETQIDCVNVSVGTQADQPCLDCVKKMAESSKPRRFTKFLWNATKSLFQIFAVLCFGMALVYLYNVFHLHYTGQCNPPSVPWRWFNIQDILDFAIKIEYSGDIPM